MESIFWIPLQIIASKVRKRSIAFRITREAIIVRTPYRYNPLLIESLLEKRKNWILTSWEKVKKREKKKERSYEENSLFSYLWFPLSLHIIENSLKNFCSSDGEKLIVWIRWKEKEKIPLLIKNWYKKRALNELSERVKELAKKYSFDQLWNIFIKTYKAKYGMCKWKDIYLDYKIIEFQKNIIDHIILHELTHLTHKHHQSSFRKKLASLDPNWKEHRDFLRGKID